MAYVYAAIVLTDFIILPMFYAILAAYLKQVPTQYHSITLEAGGMIHASFGVILGTTAYTHNKEINQESK